MYITETNDVVRNFIGEVEELEDINKLKFLIYIFGLLNNNQINNKNEINPDMLDEDDIEIFTFQSLGFSGNACTVFLQYLVMIYNMFTNIKDAYEDNGNVIGLTFDENEKKLLSAYEKMSFNEKLDIFSELIIRYDNETYFENKIPVVTFRNDISGFDIAVLIKEFNN
ncbi:MAG: hypothetical protein E7172_02830 [Firmicutes bacterium]|nr:hypothetical protein [Bacillota bacterium]